MGDRWDNFMEFVADHLGKIVFGTIALLGTGLIINTVRVDTLEQEQIAKLKAKESSFNENIKLKTGLVNFEGENVTIKYDKNEDKYEMNVFGSLEKEERGVILKDCANVNFEISKEDTLAILKAIETKNHKERFYRTSKYSSEFGTISDTYTTKGYTLSINKSKEMFNPVYEIYNALENAVINAYNHNVEVMCESSSMLNAVSNAYRYVRPEVLTEVKGSIPFGYIESEFVNCGLMVNGVSSVQHDEENNISYFYVDTLQTTDGKNYEQKKAVVSVEGANLTSEEVYYKFITGQTYQFEEVVKVKTQEDGLLLS